MKGEGFEPPIDFSNDFTDRRDRPLRHPSTIFPREGIEPPSNDYESRTLTFMLPRVQNAPSRT